MSADIVEELRARLTAALQPEALAIRDDSHLHAGHAGARGGGGHYHVDIVAAAFAGKNTVARHRLIYDAAGDLMRGPVHALSICAEVPGAV
ncbi:BolA family transcriptional regulator [Dechloromonas agitata]|uniref:BolA family transcriptional regulator n=1 Tax=Dechloromonas agitata TaxID=73030 RepID=A0A930BRL5_9RHOO|nr:BolA family protein [Dechloromonas agitata]MBF1164497.1 BolA family transcriptional regulator [Dechloromonas agitata]MDE1545311.1 BolA family transcriptional regulator [Dechloromonas agitata]